MAEARSLSPEKPLLNVVEQKEITNKSLWLCIVVPKEELPKEEKSDSFITRTKERIVDSLVGDQAAQEGNKGDAQLAKLKSEITPLKERVDILMDRLRRTWKNIGLEGEIGTPHALHIDDDEMSPDGDEIYIKIHADEGLLMLFAEKNRIELTTKRHGKVGGAAEPFTRLRHLEVGFELGPAQKQRLLIRLVKTDIQFGGCGIPVDELRKEGVIKSFFPLHNSGMEDYGLRTWAQLKEIRHPFRMPNATQKKGKAQHGPEMYWYVSRYFGEKIGLYFYWIGSYSKFLLFPAIVGLIAGLWSAIAQDWGHPGLIVFGVLLVGWAVVWDVVWQRKENEWAEEVGAKVGQENAGLRDEFRATVRRVDVHDAKTYTYPLTLFKKDGSQEEESDEAGYYEYYYPRWKRWRSLALVSMPVVLSLITALLVCLFTITRWRMNNSRDKTINYAASGLTVLVMVTFSIIYDKVARGLSWLENYRTDVEYENAFIQKSFLYYFCNAYSALYILAFWPARHKMNDDGVEELVPSDHDRMEQLRIQMIIILVVKPMVQNFNEVAIPMAKTKLRRYLDRRNAAKSGSPAPAELTPAQEQASLEPYETPMSDYQEIAIQFGYMAMFGVVFPFGPFISMLYNILEIRIDANKIAFHCQRPKADVVTSIGAWSSVFKLLTAVAVATNAYILCFLTDTFNRIGLVTGDTPAEELNSRYRVFVVSQYVLFGLVVGLYWGLPHTPVDTLKKQAKKDYLRSEEQADMIKGQLSPRASIQRRPPPRPLPTGAAEVEVDVA